MLGVYVPILHSSVCCIVYPPTGLVDILFAGARGVSLVFSSGDFGVGDGNSDAATQQCFTNDGQNSIRFLPSFPASWVLILSVCLVF